MTYIAGLRCKDGVVLVGDRKVVSADRTKASYENKLTMDVSGIVVGYAGSDILSRRFRSELVALVNSYGGQPAQFEPFVEKVEDIVTRLNQRYRDKVTDQMEVLIAARLAQPLVALRHIHIAGVADEVPEYIAIGTGEPYGAAFLKHLWRSDLSMKEAIEIGYFIVRYIERFQLVDTVGCGNAYPQIWCLSNSDPVPREIDKADAHSLEILTEQRLARLPTDVVELFRSGNL